jgi:hypothetical protein
MGKIVRSRLTLATLHNRRNFDSLYKAKQKADEQKPKEKEKENA